MSHDLGRVVLRQVADRFEATPASWSKDGNGGTLKGAEKLSAETISARLCDPDENGCIDTTIRCYARLVAGKKEWPRAAKQARRILCRHHGLWFGRLSIRIFNDDHCKSTQEAVDFIDAALGGPAKPVPMHTYVPAKGKLLEDA